MRDINDDLHRHPYDEDLRNIAIGYANLIRPMVETIDKHGLKKWFLTRHVPAVEKFFRWLLAEKFASETAQTYQKRFKKTVRSYSHSWPMMACLGITTTQRMPFGPLLNCGE
jgi:hypothetical protein